MFSGTLLAPKVQDPLPGSFPLSTALPPTCTASRSLTVIPASRNYSSYRILRLGSVPVLC